MIGLTETCAGTFVSLPNDLSMLGTVGPPVPNVDVRLESVPEMGYDALSEVPRGEICIKGNTLFSGYYKREDLTEEIWVYGNSFESFLVAIINPNKQALEHWAELNGITGDFSKLCENPKAKEYILGELTKIGKEKK
ncbi:hypothetical protein BHM03_00044630, partial [Ensete ventricosum]